MAKRKLRPYSVYLSEEHHKALSKLAKNRKASEMIRNSIELMIQNKDVYKAAYNKGLEDAAEVVGENEHAQLISVEGRGLDTILAEEIETLEMI